jgi:hypothetical protein
MLPVRALNTYFFDFSRVRGTMSASFVAKTFCRVPAFGTILHNRHVTDFLGCFQLNNWLLFVGIKHHPHSVRAPAGWLDVQPGSAS